MNTKIITIVCLIVFAIGCIEIEDAQPKTPSQTVEYFVKHLQVVDDKNYEASYQMMSTNYRNNTNLETFSSNVQNTNEKLLRAYKYTILSYNDSKSNNTTILEIQYDISNKKNSWLPGLNDVEHEQESIQLVKESDGWRFVSFPTKLVLVAKTS